jgi:hypothetical protein
MRVFYYFNSSLRKDNHEVDPCGILKLILARRRIRVSNISKVNDPTDFQVGFPPSASSSYIEGFRKQYKDIEKEFGIVCFSETPFNVLMWSHYADGHRGFVLELEMDESKLEQVAYSTIAPQIPPEREGLSRDAILKDIAHRALRTKSIEWAYEKEWRRIVRYNTSISDIQKEGESYYLTFDSSSLKSLFAGLRQEKTDAEIKKILENAGFPKLPIYRFERTRMGFGLQCEAYRKDKLKEAIKSLLKMAPVISPPRTARD